jgi:adenosylmethionine-8-amino-7-oxononanoate aminotransferase
MLTEYSDVKDVVMQAHLRADGGTHLHVLAYAGDPAACGAALAETSACLYLADELSSPQQELTEGDEVRLSPEYRRYRDAASGPLRPSDIGVIVAVQQGSTQPMRVSFGGRSWWYAREALEPIEPALPRMPQDRCACVGCVNRLDLTCFTS